MPFKNSKKEKKIDFETINERDALIQMKTDFDLFTAALVKMKMVDNFDHFIPSGLKLFVEFFYLYHDFIYKNQENTDTVYTTFLDWLYKQKNI